jgi:(p)ppGpp synthase/HD superfamily hydrolase
VKASDGPVFEVQIRSVAMDRQAERGDAAHWLYKKNGREAARKSDTRNWLTLIRRWTKYAAS